jgi:RNA polymerase sigma-70 factor (ECF subfamily)
MDPAGGPKFSGAGVARAMDRRLMGRSKDGGASPHGSEREASPSVVGAGSGARAQGKRTPVRAQPVNTEEKEASIASAETSAHADRTDSPDRPDGLSAEGSHPPDDEDGDGDRTSVPPPATLPGELPPELVALPVVPEGKSAEERQRDLELVRRVQAGERPAFRELFDRHHKRAFAVAFGVLKHRQDAMDVVQESFVKVHKHIGSFQGTSSFYTWLYRIVMNLAIDQLRRRKTGRNVEYDDAVLREGEAAIHDAILPRMTDENPRKAVIRRELLARMEAALAELPEYHRQVILLREVEGLSYEEMAEALDVPKGTIMSRLFHARRKMQSALEGYVDGDMDIEE